MTIQMTAAHMTTQDLKKPWIGQSVERLEDPPLVAGRGEFAGDINFAHQLHMRIARSAHAHGRIVAIDAAAARALPGVFAVWTCADVRRLAVMCSAIFLRITDIFSIRSSGKCAFGGSGLSRAPSCRS